MKKDKRSKLAIDTRALNNSIVSKVTDVKPRAPRCYGCGRVRRKGRRSKIHIVSHAVCIWINATRRGNQKHCNFQIIGVRANGMYRFLPVFCGFTRMPTEFDKNVGKEIADLPKTHTFLLAIYSLSQKYLQTNITQR